jgi:serine phosphatase RsbU (regulator of sigma subunit)
LTVWLEVHHQNIFMQPFAEYETGTYTLRCVNAGHHSPLALRCRQNHCEVFRLASNGTPLGLLEAPYFTSASFQLERGDVLVMYTERLEMLVRTCSGYTPAQIVKRILDKLLMFADGCSQRDDLTIVVVWCTD